MKTKILQVLSAIILFSAYNFSQNINVTFQQGVNGYTGCRSVNISDLNYIPGNNGTTFADGNNDWCIGKLHGRPGFGYDISPLLRFDSLNIPANAVIISATLTITHVMWEIPSSRVIGRYLNVDWYGNLIDSIGGIGNAPIGWERRFPGIPWNTLGATGEGTDLIANKQFFSPPDGSIMPSNGEITYNIPLDVDVVQGWINNSANNHGVKLQVDAPNVHIYYRPPQRPDIIKRPKLSVTYTIPTGIENQTEIPAEYYLMQNYPNPFNPVTIISYGLPADGNITLSVYDMLGNTSEVLYTGYKQRGNHTISFNGGKYSSGIYFCRLSYNGNTLIRKMTLIK